MRSTERFFQTALKQFTCDVHVMGKSVAKDIVAWLKTASQAEAKIAAQAQFPGQKLGSVTNVREKK